jgi:hypothetical protein
MNSAGLVGIGRAGSNNAIEEEPQSPEARFFMMLPKRRLGEDGKAEDS